MGVFIVEGGERLEGRVTVSGSKNAALPVLFAAISVCGVSEIAGLPHIEDVHSSLRILHDLGARIEWSGNTAYIDTRVLKNAQPDPSVTARIRASTYLIGGMLARFGKAALYPFGGCNFSARPIDMHISAAQAYGAEMSGNELICKRLRGAEVAFSKKSVGATVNSLIMAASAEGESRITGASEEPHIDTLIEFLNSAGASVVRRGDVITVRGTSLHGGAVTIPGDMIEAGTYLALGAITGGSVRVSGASTEELVSFVAPILHGGSQIKISGGECSLLCPPKRKVEIVTSPFPGFPTDLQPIAAPLLAFGGGGSITDTVWRERFGYLCSLGKMGITYSLNDNQAEILPSKIISADVVATDLRGGAACLIAALSARGKSSISSAEAILRGYEMPVEKLLSLGAKIKYSP